MTKLLITDKIDLREQRLVWKTREVIRFFRNACYEEIGFENFIGMFTQRPEESFPTINEFLNCEPEHEFKNIDEFIKILKKASELENVNLDIDFEKNRRLIKEMLFKERIDIDKIASDISFSHRGELIRVREIINNLSKEFGRVIPVDEIINTAKLKDISADKIEKTIEKLKCSGDIYEPIEGFISKL